MKKRILAFAFVLIMIISFCACGKETDEPDTVRITFNTDGGSLINSVEIKKGSSIIKPESPVKDGFVFVKWLYDGSEYDFSSPVNTDITLLAEWKSADGNNNKEDNKPDDKPSDVNCESLSFTNSWYWIQINTEAVVPYSVSPAECEGKIVFTSSDEKIATVDKNTGLVHGVKSGKITLTAKCGNKTATIPVEIRAFGEGISFNKHEIDLTYMSQFDYCDDLTVTTTPEYIVNPEIYFSSSNTDVATVDADGYVQAVKPGHAVITVSDAYGHSDTCDVYVNGAYLDVGIVNTTLSKDQETDFYAVLVKFAHGLSSSVPVCDNVYLSGEGINNLSIQQKTVTDHGYLKYYSLKDTSGYVNVYFVFNNIYSEYSGLQSDEIQIYLNNY